MSFLGFIAGATTLALTGGGLTILLMRGTSRINLAECLALGWTLGIGVVSLLFWIFGFCFSGPLLAAFVGACCFCLCFAAWRTARRSTITFHLPRPATLIEYALLILLGLQVALFFWVALKQPLGWDGLLVWEIKARYAFLSDNVLPAQYFTSGREYSHPEYPLAIPFAELWIYLWMGDANQFWIKALFPISYAAGMILLAVFAARFTGKRWAGLLTAVLFFFVPQASLGTGGASSGYVDFPISIVYCAAIAYLLFTLTRDSAADFNCYAACLALLPWFKRDGTILWLVAAAAGVVVILIKRRPLQWLLAVTPGAIIIVAWNIFLRVMHAPSLPEFVSPTWSTFVANVGRVTGVYRAVFFEMHDGDNWGTLWLMAALAGVYLLIRARRPESLVLFGAILLPLVVYSCVYIFSAWPDYLRHAGSSMPRLLTHTVPLLWVALASAFAAPPRRI